MTSLGCITVHSGLLGRPWATLLASLASTDSVQALFFQILMEKLVLLISTPLPDGMAVCASPGDQVEASGAPKSTRAAKSRPVGARWEQPGQSSWPCRLGLAVNVMESTANQPELKSSQS